MKLQSICCCEQQPWLKQWHSVGDLSINLLASLASQARLALAEATVLTEGQVLLLFLPVRTPFPLDGIRYQDQEVKYNIPVGPNRASRSLSTLHPASNTPAHRNSKLPRSNTALYPAHRTPTHGGPGGDTV